jgi:hypothetical protein
MYVTIVEDDYYQADLIEESLRNRFRDIRCRRLRTEHEFRTAIPELVADPPNAFIVDVMLRWTDPAPEMPKAPPNVRRGGSHRAGLRCKKLLADTPALRDIKTILYTVLDKADLAKELSKLPDVIHIRKDADPTELLEALQYVSQQS